MKPTPFFGNRIFATAAALLAAVLVASPLAAQNIDNVKSRLSHSERGENGHTARVTVHESGSAAEAVRRGEAASAANRTVNGFRIVIFFDNDPSARSEAERIMQEFAAAYPDVRCDIRYENPYFKVLAGSCVTSEEAVILLGRIKLSFPEAYIMREEMPVQNFITPESQPVAEPSEGDSDGSPAANTV